MDPPCFKEEAIPEDHGVAGFFEEDPCTANIDDGDRIGQIQINGAHSRFLAQVKIRDDTLTVERRYATGIGSEPHSRFTYCHDPTKKLFGLLVINRGDVDAVQD